MSLPNVVVTGAATGIGRSCALHLAEHGFHVLAGVYPDAFEAKDGEDLAGHPQIEVVPLDVTDAASVRALAARVEHGLAGLVNNAAISVAGPLEVLPLERVQRQFEVNVIGTLAVTQAMLPALRQARGRIVNLGSVQGRLTLPLAGAYCASKSALAALSSALRMELQPWGIQVVTIEPGYVATRMADKAASSWDALELTAEARLLYRPSIERARALVASVGDLGSPPEVVAEAIRHALTAPRPRPRMLVARGARTQALIAACLPERWKDRLIERAFDWLGRRRAG